MPMPSIPIISPVYTTNCIPVVTSSSNFYAPYTGVLIQSIIDHSNEGNNYDIIILEREISEENKRLLLSLKGNRKNVFIRFYNPSSLCSDIEEDPRYPLEVYWRVYIPYLFTQYEKIAVIASDMILKKDVAQLFAVNLNGACLGAARDIGAEAACRGNLMFRPTVSKMTGYDYLSTELKMKNPYNYINPDAVLYDPKKFVSECDFSDITLFIKEHDCLYLDQDVLSTLMEDKILFLSLEWNFGIPLGHQQNRYFSLVSQETQAAYVKASESPAILHWAGKPKPWVCPDVPYGNEWWDIAKRTPFMGHIIARMISELQTRKEYYKDRYGQDVAVWDPIPNVDRSKKYK